LVWVDREGREEPIKGLPVRSFIAPRLSPDGTRVALQIGDRDNDIWLWNFARETLDRLTMDPGTDQAPVWTLDGRRVIFTSEAGGGPGSLFWQTIDGSGKEERLTPISNVQRASAVLKNGTIIFSESRLATAVDIMALTFDKNWRSQPILESAAAEAHAEVSPNGRWLAYVSNEAGLLEVFVRPFPDVASQKIKISADGGGMQPVWARDGNELFYLAPNGALMSVTVRPDNNLSPGPPRKLMDEPYLRVPTQAAARTYDVSENGKRFLRIKPSSGPEATVSIVVVQNWFEELKRLVPSGR
jgi:eukaryotic-like serine/threonine-protein kinase